MRSRSSRLRVHLRLLEQRVDLRVPVELRIGCEERREHSVRVRVIGAEPKEPDVRTTRDRLVDVRKSLERSLDVGTERRQLRHELARRFLLPRGSDEREPRQAAPAGVPSGRE